MSYYWSERKGIGVKLYIWSQRQYGKLVFVFLNHPFSAGKSSVRHTSSGYRWKDPVVGIQGKITVGGNLVNTIWLYHILKPSISQFIHKTLAICQC